MTSTEIKAKLFDLDINFRQVQEEYKRQSQDLYKQLAEVLKKEKDGASSTEKKKS